MTIGNTTTNYTYDANSRLVSAETTYAYDWVGNRNPSTHTYNAADQLTTSPGHVYEYWGTGSLQLQEDESTVTEKRYDYTPANLLASVTHVDVSGEPVSSMTWDADGNRVSFTSSADSGVTQFVYDTTAGIPAVIEETGSVYYIREPNGALIARISGSGESQVVNYYHFDALGSTRLLTDASGAVTDTYRYDAWGNATHDTGGTQQPYQFVGCLGYYTHVQDANLPLLQLGVRFYEPGPGRFTQLGSPYTFAGNNPVDLHQIGRVIVRIPRMGGNPDEIDADIAQAGYGGTHCAWRARNRAIGIVQGMYGARRPWNDGWENAVMHCVLTCMIAGECGRQVALITTNNHERYNWNDRTGWMDLCNNKEGLNCYDWAPPLGQGTRRDYGQTCVDCCLKRVNSGHYCLPCNEPMPHYPGGNR